MASDPVLIVDDGPQSLKLAKVILAADGYEVKTAIGAGDESNTLGSFTRRRIPSGVSSKSLSRRERWAKAQDWGKARKALDR